jgi:uncharacterized membrane-anchored protein
MTTRLDSIVREAIAQGLFTHFEPTDGNTRPWPVMVVTAVLAWLVAIPLVLLLGLMIHLEPGVGMTVLGLLMLAGAVAALRTRELPIFWEQLTVPVLIAGATMFVVGISHSGKQALIGGIAAALALAISAAIPQNWLRILLGAAAASLFADAWAGSGFLAISTPAAWLSWHIVVGCWLALYLLQHTLEGKAPLVAVSAWVEALLIGVGVMSLCALSFYSGRTFLLAASLPLTEAGGSGSSVGAIASATSLILAAVAAVWICYRWPALRRPSLIPVAMAVMLACWFASSMGAVLFVLALCMTSGRRGLAILAGVAVLWMVGGFYYQLAWPLAHKALLLLACAAVFAVVAGFGFGMPRAFPDATSRTGARDEQWKRWILAGSGALVLVIANAAILQKEKLAEDGTIMYVKLAPVDPRSLMQGDYMRLSFAIPRELMITDRPGTLALGRRDERGVVTILERYRGAALAKDEVLIELVSKNGRNVVATDAWFFAEGEAKRWSRAEYAEFRVTPDGQALLIGLRGPRLEKL